MGDEREEKKLFCVFLKEEAKGFYYIIYFAHKALTKTTTNERREKNRKSVDWWKSVKHIASL
jgi:hypothetical protein